MIDIDKLDDRKQQSVTNSKLRVQDLDEARTTKSTCSGYRLQLPNGMSAHTMYPFALHNTLSLPWDYAVRSGVMTLHAQSCTKFVNDNHDSCQRCYELRKNTRLQGILTRLEEGVSEYSPLAYHGFGGLHDLLRRKNARIEFYRLRGLNQARKLMGKATEISEYKRFTVALASGKVERIDRIIQVGLSQKKGIRGLMAMMEAAAVGVYHPRSWTEEEEMRAILLWRLGGKRSAEINHRARGDPSLTTLRSLSFAPPVIPSHAQPTVDEVSKNVQAAFANVLDVVQSRVKTLHTVLMFDELATEKRIRWDAKTNYFLGVCREHGHKTSLEFVNEGDMEELFAALDDGEVHYAAEVGVSRMQICFRFDHFSVRQPSRPWVFSPMIIEFILLAQFLPRVIASVKVARSMLN